MAQAHRISRRMFRVGLGLSIPAARMDSRGFAQTPEAASTSDDPLSVRGSTLIAMTPHDLLQMLLTTPFDEGSAILGVDFEQSRWMDIGHTPYITAVGGVRIQRSSDSGLTEPDTLGGYGVYLRDDGAQSAMLLGERAVQDQTQNTYPVQIGNRHGKTIVHGRDLKVLTMIPVGNVLVIANDILLDDGPRTTADTGIYRSVRYATVLLEHLDRITSLQT